MTKPKSYTADLRYGDDSFFYMSIIPLFIFEILPVAKKYFKENIFE